MTLVLGIDDAGRGPVIGPMILAGALLKGEDEIFLKEEGVADSKQLAHPVRIKLSGIIKDVAKNYHVVITQADDIDNAILTGTNLNTLEAIKTAEIINRLTEDIEEDINVIVDCPSTNTIAWKKTLMHYVKNPSHLNVSCEHKADVNHPCVSAASILAKVAREEEVSRLKDEYSEYGNIGSGYPSDPVTKAFLRKNGKILKDKNLFRKTWATWKEVFPEKAQSTLGDY